jgi:hypothetical protein
MNLARSLESMPRGKGKSSRGLTFLTQLPDSASDREPAMYGVLSSRSLHPFHFISSGSREGPRILGQESEVERFSFMHFLLHLLLHEGGNRGGHFYCKHTDTDTFPQPVPRSKVVKGYQYKSETDIGP